jgi:transcriptional regulator with XRE-family HTH domain
MRSKGANFSQKQLQILAVLGENIKLSRLRRKISIRSMAERAGLAPSTVGAIEQGSPSVSMGSYLQVLSIIKLEEDLLLVAEKDPIGRQIQDAGLIVKKRAPKKKAYKDVLSDVIDIGHFNEPKFD